VSGIIALWLNLSNRGTVSTSPPWPGCGRALDSQSGTWHNHKFRFHTRRDQCARMGWALSPSPQRHLGQTRCAQCQPPYLWTSHASSSHQNTIGVLRFGSGPSLTDRHRQHFASVHCTHHLAWGCCLI